MKRILLLLTVAMLCNIGILAQGKKIIGTVVDKDYQPLIGVQVMEESSDVAVITDLDGRFEITVQEGSKLVFSMLGTKTKTVEASDGMVVVLEYGRDGYNIGGFQGMFDINTNFTPSHGGIGAEFIFGSRLKQYCHTGGGICFHSLISPEIDDYNLLVSIYFNNVFYIPTKTVVSPMFDLAVGCHFGGWWSGVATASYKETVFGLYAKVGFGFEAKKFMLSAGYELIGAHTGYAKIGFRF